MFRITVELEGVKATVEDKDAVMLDEVLPLLTQALKGVGFHPEGELEFVEAVG